MGLPRSVDLAEIMDDPDRLRRRANVCRQQANSTEHARLAEAFLELADALDLAASAADMANRRVLH